jgi:hypothetical protein
MMEKHGFAPFPQMSALEDVLQCELRAQPRRRRVDGSTKSRRFEQSRWGAEIGAIDEIEDFSAQQ